MYSDRELNRLAAHKAALRGRIAGRRMECVATAGRVMRPLAWLDRVVDFWRRLPPVVQFAAVPLGLLATRAELPRRSLLGSLLSWGPLVFSVVRRIGAKARTSGGVAGRG